MWLSVSVNGDIRQEPVIILKLFYVTKHLSIYIELPNSAHRRFEHPWRLPFSSDVMDGLNVTYALGVSVSFCMGAVVYALALFVSVRC